MKIDFDDPTHAYRIDSVPVPGVTEVISGLGLVDTRWFTDEHRFRGKAVHAAVHYWLEDDLRRESLSSGLVGYVEAAIKFITEAKLEVQHVEARLGSARYQFCGTADFVGTILGRPAVIDWKSGAIAATTGLQLAGYALCLEESAPGPRPRYRRIGVQLSPDGTYRKQDFTDHRDERRFLAALDLYRAFVRKEGRSNASARSAA